jgi:hypothetical protein
MSVAHRGAIEMISIIRANKINSAALINSVLSGER